MSDDTQTPDETPAGEPADTPAEQVSQQDEETQGLGDSAEAGADPVGDEDPTQDQPSSTEEAGTEDQSGEEPTSSEQTEVDSTVDPATKVEELVQEAVNVFDTALYAPERLVEEIVHHFNHHGTNVTPRGRGLGFVKGDPDERDFVYDHTKEQVGDLTGSEGLSPAQLPPIWNQLNIGSCTAHGSLRAYVASLMKEGVALPPLNTAVAGQGTPAPFSRLQQYYDSRALEGSVSEDSGAQVRDALKALATNGVAPETLWPYNTSQFAVEPPALAVTQARLHKSLKYESLTPTGTAGGPEHVAVAAGKVVVFGFQVPAYFEDPDQGISWDPASGQPLPVPPAGYSNWIGGHCVALTWVNYTQSAVAHPGGFSVPAGSVVIDNSWDTTWGIGGRFIMDAKWLTSGYASDFWVIDLAE